MEENAELIKKIKDGLKFTEYTWELLSEKDQDYLIRIEKAVSECFAKEEESQRMVSRNNVSTKGIAKLTGINRQTLYNRLPLKCYIESRASDFSKIDKSRLEKEKDEKIDRLEEEVEKFHKRDVEYMNMKAKCKEKDRLIEVKDRTIEMYRDKIKELESELKAVKKGTSIYN